MHTNTNKVDQAIQRVMSIKWNSFDYEKMASYRALIKEYLRRLVLWTKALNIVDKWPRISFPMLSLFKKIPIDTLVIDNLHTYLSENTNFHAVNLCIGYVCWKSIEDNEKIKEFNLPDLYEPLIFFFERGGYFKPDRGGFLDELDVSINDWKDYDYEDPFVELNEEILDRLDTKL